jgi:hypothetical protein
VSQANEANETQQAYVSYGSVHTWRMQGAANSLLQRRTFGIPTCMTLFTPSRA